MYDRSMFVITTIAVGMVCDCFYLTTGVRSCQGLSSDIFRSLIVQVTDLFLQNNSQVLYVESNSEFTRHEQALMYATRV